MIPILPLLPYVVPVVSYVLGHVLGHKTGRKRGRVEERIAAAGDVASRRAADYVAKEIEARRKGGR